MKRQRRKLKVGREHIRVLALDRVRGGMIPSDPFNCGSFTCEVTCTSNTCAEAMR